MIIYIIGTPRTYENLKRELPDVNRPWYADNSGALGTLSIIGTYLNSLTRQDPGHGYHPKPLKSVQIVHLENIEAGKVFGARHKFKVCTGARYLGGYTGGQRVQMRLAERAYADVGEEH